MPPNGKADSQATPVWPEWDFEKHCTKQLPEKNLTMHDLGHEGDHSFAITCPFTVLTPEAVKICREIVLNDQKVRQHCKFNACDHAMTPNSYAFRNVGGINPFYKGMLSCKKFEAYLQKCCNGEPVTLWKNTWLKGHVNVQEGKEAQDKPNVDWHYDKAMFAMLINVSDMPENPRGGDTLLKKLNGEIVPMKYRVPGDSTIIKGSRILHCGIGAENYNKICVAPGLGNGDVTVPDLNNDFNKTHWENSDPINFMKQWTEIRLERIEEQIDLLVKTRDPKLLANMKAENALMKDNFELFYEGIKPKDSPWLA